MISRKAPKDAERVPEKKNSLVGREGGEMLGRDPQELEERSTRVEGRKNAPKNASFWTEQEITGMRKCDPDALLLFNGAIPGWEPKEVGILGGRL